jgi:hypothetical protein
VFCEVVLEELFARDLSGSISQLWMRFALSIGEHFTLEHSIDFSQGSAWWVFCKGVLYGRFASERLVKTHDNLSWTVSHSIFSCISGVTQLRPSAFVALGEHFARERLGSVS